MKDKRGRVLGSGDRVVYREKLTNGRVRWKTAEVVSVGIKFVHIIPGDGRRLRLLPEGVERLPR